jgi:predicted TIM-barrel fold metal-dependent hydrolase
MSIFDEAKIDAHCHVFDPARHPYLPDTFYRPSGHEIAPVEQLWAVMEAYGVEHALLVGPNSGYASDNRCLLDALARSDGRLKGIAVVEREATTAELAALKAQGVIGIAFNATLLGCDYYRSASQLVQRLADLDMLLQIQCENDQLIELMSLIAGSNTRVLIDHCGRPDPLQGVDQPGFQALLALGRSGRGAVKLSGYSKLSRQAYPWNDGWPFVRALVGAFSLDRCVWGSDWPFLRAPARVDYGTLLTLVERLFPDPADRRKLLWDTPARLFGFPC